MSLHHRSEQAVVVVREAIDRPSQVDCYARTQRLQNSIADCTENNLTGIALFDNCSSSAMAGRREVAPVVSEDAKKRAEAAKLYIENMLTDRTKHRNEKKERWVF
jgi:hypothetical protein